MKNRCLGLLLTVCCLVPPAVLAAAGANDPAAATADELAQAFGSDAAGIEVRVEEGKAILTGHASQRSTAELAEEVALSVPGITAVENKISAPRPRPADKLRLEAEDAALEVSVKAALARSVGTDLSAALEVEACDGVVSLRGEVAARDDASRAVEAAQRVREVKRVLDLIAVSGT